MSKVIFVLQRRAGLTRYIQNHAGPAPAEAVCDGIGELWFATDDLMNKALNSPQMAAAVEDAKRFLDMERTGMILVQEKILIGLSAITPRQGATCVQSACRVITVTVTLLTWEGQPAAAGDGRTAAAMWFAMGKDKTRPSR